MIHSIVAAGRQVFATYSTVMACVLDNDNDKLRRWRVSNNDKPDKSLVWWRITGYVCLTYEGWLDKSERCRRSVRFFALLPFTEPHLSRTYSLLSELRFFSIVAAIARSMGIL